jgi:hypothetical protein
LFIGLAWIPFLARVPDSTCRKDIVDDLVRGRLLKTMALWCAAGFVGRSMTCPLVGLPAAVEAAGSRAAVGRRGSDRVSDP